MQWSTRLWSVVAIMWICFFRSACANTVLISQALKGRAYGSQTSRDIARRIVSGSDRFVYIAGTTTPINEDDNPWGDAEAGQATAKTDVFLAKLSVEGDLIWVKREGSLGDESLKDLKLANNALYLCGSTTGNLAAPLKGKSDGFIMKYGLDGTRAWDKPYQFGSDGDDSCNAIVIDERRQNIFVAGSTSGLLFGPSQPRGGLLQKFVAKYEEINDRAAGLQLLMGRQRGSPGNCSADEIAIVNNFIYTMSTSWSLQDKAYAKAATYLNVYDRDALLLHKLHAIRSDMLGSFRGLRMAAGNDSVYFVGHAITESNRTVYQALSFSITADGHEGSVSWVTRVGEQDEGALFIHQTPSIAVNTAGKSVYVAGVEDGYFYDSQRQGVGMVIVPFLSLAIEDGTVRQRWHRTTSVPQGKEEVTDITLVAGKVAVYTGAWNGGLEPLEKALLGSFGSPTYASRMRGADRVTNSTNAATSRELMSSSSPCGWEFVVFTLLGVAAVGAIVLVIYMIALSRWTHHYQAQVEDAMSTKPDSEWWDDGEVEVFRARRRSGITFEDVMVHPGVGGSAGPR